MEYFTPGVAELLLLGFGSQVKASVLLDQLPSKGEALIVNFHGINTFNMTNFKLLMVEVGTVLCSDVREQAVSAPTPRSWTQPNSQLACPHLLP